MAAERGVVVAEVRLRTGDGTARENRRPKPVGPDAGLGTTVLTAGAALKPASDGVVRGLGATEAFVDGFAKVVASPHDGENLKSCLRLVALLKLTGGAVTYVSGAKVSCSSKMIPRIFE